MDKELESGRQMLDSFFERLKDIPGLDEKVAEIVLGLYKDNKLTDSRLSNALLELREKELRSDKD